MGSGLKSFKYEIKHVSSDLWNFVFLVKWALQHLEKGTEKERKWERKREGKREREDIPYVINLKLNETVSGGIKENIFLIIVYVMLKFLKNSFFSSKQTTEKIL